MKIVTERMFQSIVDELADNGKSLVSPLLRTKVLATRLGNTELAEWVSRELSGYDDYPPSELPKYRIAKANTSCTLQQGYLIQRNVPVPITLIPEEGRRFFLEFPFTEGVSTLEHYLSQNPSDSIGRPLAADAGSFITAEIKKGGNSINIGDIVVSTHVSSITQILAEVRSNFLDLLLELESEFPDIVDVNSITPQTKSEINDKIVIIMSQNNITNNGHGNAINTGGASNLNASMGSNNSQSIDSDEFKNDIRDTLELLLQAIADKEFSDKEDIEIEVARIENQLTKDNPKPELVKESLLTINNILTSIAANVWTEPVITAIQSVLGAFGM